MTFALCMVKLGLVRVVIMKVSLTFNQLENFIIINAATGMRISESDHRIWFTEYDGNCCLPSECIKCSGWVNSEVFGAFSFTKFSVRRSRVSDCWIAKLQA